MLSSENKKENQKQFFDALLVPTVLVVFMILTFIFEKGMELDFHRAGIYPRSIKGITGVITYIFIHADLKHLLNNIFSFFILSVSLFYFYKPLALPILLFSNLISGVLLWIIGRDSWHIGASGLIYALAFFLFFSGLIRKHIPLIAISLIITFLYGNMVWHVIPWQVNDPVSWEGHLTGSISGFILAVIYRHKGPQKPIKVWEEDDENEVNIFENQIFESNDIKELNDENSNLTNLYILKKHNF